MSDYSVMFDDGQWWVMDMDFKFDNFDTKEEAEREVYLLDSMVEIEKTIYDVAKGYDNDQLNYFIRCYNLYGLRDIWKGLLK